MEEEYKEEVKVNNVMDKELEKKPTKFTDKILNSNFRVIKRIIALFVIWNVILSILLLSIIL